MNSETLPPTSPAEYSGRRDLSGVVNDSRRRQLDIFRQRESDLDGKLAPLETLEANSNA